MNVERLREILQVIRQDVETTRLDQNLQQLQNKLQEVVNNPGAEQPQTQLVQALEKLKQSLDAAPSNTLGPIWAHSVEQLGLQRMLPASIGARIDDIFQRSQITPSVALNEVQQLRQSVSETRDQIVQLLSSLEGLGFKQIEIPQGMADLGMLVPRTAIDNNLDRFSSEAHLLNLLLTHLSEAVTGEPADVQIESISTTDIATYVQLACSVALAFSIAFEKIVNSYVKLEAARTHRDGLRSAGFSKEQLDFIDAHARKMIRKEVNDSVADILRESPVTDAGRRNELETSLQKLFWGLAKRLGRGYNFDVRLRDDADQSEDPVEKKAAAVIKNIRKSLEFIKVTGDNLLELTPGEDAEEPEESPEDPTSGDDAVA